MNAEPASTALHSVADWLLCDAALRPAEAGRGVVNYLHADGQWNGLYPEICGYHMQFAAHAGAAAGHGHDAAFRSAAADVAVWLDHVGGPQMEPPTLYFRLPEDADWRSKCLFAFDLAIIARGLGAAESRWPGVLPAGLLDRTIASISRIVENGRMASHLLRAGASASEIPVKWSTTMGVHHVKAAAALAGLGLPALSDMVAATFRDEMALFAKHGAARMRELHPFLYFIEGWLTLWGQTQDPEALAAATRAFTMVLGQIDPRTGEVFAIANQPQSGVRSDVVGQALRAGLVLEAAGQLSDSDDTGWAERRHALHARLLTCVAPDGGILFDKKGGHRNAWVSMFGWQALQLLQKSQLKLLDPIAAAAALI